MTSFGKLCLVVVSAGAGGCNPSSAPPALPAANAPVAAPSTKALTDVHSVEELLANPRNFGHNMVTVRGCFVLNFEVEVLQSCDGTSSRRKPIWVEDAGIVAMEIRDELMYAPKGGLLFTYDEARNLRARRRLPSGHSIAGSEVVLFGQFETGANGFGHLNAYPSELILVDVVSKRATAIPSKVQ